MTAAEQTVEAPNAPLFSQVQFYIVESQGLGLDLIRELKETLEANGAVEHCPSSNHANISLKGITHIISSTTDFQGYEKAEDAFIPVVTPDWVASSIEKKKHANPRSHSPDPRFYFSGLIVYIADLPEGDKDAIIGGVLAMGGLYSASMTKTVTHIVALTMEPAACQAVVSRHLPCKIVLPHWFDDCLRLGRRIDEGPYTLPHPEVVEKPHTDRVGDKNRPDLKGATGRLITPAESPAPERRKLNVFKDKAVMLSKDLEIGDHLRKTVEDLIKAGKGKIVHVVDNADIFVCHFREGSDYITASHNGIEVGNLSWLYYLISHNSWTSPLRRLLHYPIARGGLPGFKDFRISLSNYNGEARVYLENLAKAAGCEFTKTMKQDNTHLITAHMISEKCNAAKEWDINMINHLWLEESYAKWQIQSLANPRYTHFPPRTNLTEVVGQTPIDRQALERNFFPKASKAPKTAQNKDSLKAMQHRDGNVAKATPAHRKSEPVRSNKHSDVTTPITARKEALHSTGKVIRTPATKFAGEGKENETPPTTGSRSAKDRAVAKLHDLADDMALYEKEKKRVGGVVFGGRKKSDPDIITPRKRSHTPDSDDSGMELDDEDRPVKRAKTTKGPPEIKLLVTGYDRWTENHKKESDDRVQLRELGILISNDVVRCTHLAAPKVLRTRKFTCAIAHAPMVVHTKYLEECIYTGRLLDPNEYILKDPEGEKRYELKLPRVLARAKANKGKLLQGLPIYCTERIHAGFETYKAIVEANGGTCLLYRGRVGSVAVSKRETESDGEDEEKTPVPAYLISGLTPEERRLWPKFRQMAQADGREARIARTDWMLDLALKQEMKWGEKYDATVDDDMLDS